MRIAVVIERFGGPGGVESVGFELARALGARGVDVSVFCRLERMAAPAGVKLQRLAVSALWQPLRIRAFSRAAARATERGFDVVHSLSRTRHQHIYRAGGGTHAGYMERVYGRPMLQRALSPRHRAILGIEEAVFRDPAQLIQCNSNFVADEIAQRYAVPDERRVTIYNGVDVERFAPEPNRAAADAIRTDLDLDGPTALFAGTGFERKGLDRAIRGLAAGAPKARLLVAGRGNEEPFRALARELGVAEGVQFLGERDDLPGLLAAVDLMVLPTRYDAFANACIEAMAAGVPVATTRSNGAAELIEPGRNGFLLDDDFAPAFARLEDPAALRQLGQAARETAQTYTWDRHASQLIALYERIGSRA